MGPPRVRMLDELREVAGRTGHRVGVYFTVGEGAKDDEDAVLIHSKLTVGSANLSNRSMGLDTEPNVTWEASRGQRGLARSAGLGKYLDELARSRRARLRLLTREAFFEDQQWLKALGRWGFSFDPAGPAIEETLHEAMESASPEGGRTWFRRWFGGGEGWG